MQCLGTEENPHGPNEFDIIETNGVDHANLQCDICDVILEVSETVAERHGQ